jgi:hypothetical protein
MRSYRCSIMFLIWLSLVIVLLASGVILLVSFSVSFDKVKPFIDSLASDGNVELFSYDLFFNMSNPARLCGFVLTLLGFAAAFGRQGVYQLFIYVKNWVCRTLKDFGHGIVDLFQDISKIRNEGRYLYFIAAITLFGVFTRLPFLFQPMGHDEAYTIAAYGVAHFKDIISDYWLTNNHIFHSLLVSLCYHVFGYAPWSVRLPVFLSGVLVIPVAYRKTAMVSAAAVAGLPLLIYYSTTARGYIITALVTLLIFALGDYVRRYRNLAAWVLISLLSAIGFYTIPIMLYPFGILCTWLFLSAIFKDTAKTYSSALGFVIHLLVCVFITGLLTLIFYLPVFFNTGFSPLGSDYLASQPWGLFLDNLKLRMANTWSEFNMDLPGWVGYIEVLGFFLALFFHRRISEMKVPTQLATILWLGLALIIYRIDPWPKIWTFLLPLIIIWTFAGIISPLRLISRPVFSKIGFQSSILVIIISVIVLGATVRSLDNFSYLSGKKGDVEATVLYLKENLRPGDLFIVSWPDDAPFWYYVKLHEIPHDHIDRSKPFERTLVLVNEPSGQTLESVMIEQGPDPFLFDMNTAKKIKQNGSISVYELIPDKRLIEKIFEQ